MNKLGAIFANNLIRLREIEGLSQDAFAEKLGISLRAYQRYESGERTPKGSVLEGIAKKLSLEPSDLYKDAYVRKQITPFAETLSVSRLVELTNRKVLSVPDKVYELALKLDPGHDVWKGIEGYLQGAVNEKEAISKSRDQSS